MIDARFVIERIEQPDGAQMLDHHVSSDHKTYISRTFSVDGTVPVTRQMMAMIQEVRGVAVAGRVNHDRYRFHFTVGMLFDPAVVEHSVREMLSDYVNTLDPATCLPMETDEDDEDDDTEECPFCRLARQGVRFAVMPIGQDPEA